MPEPYAIINQEEHPVITVRFTGNPANEKNFQDYLDGIRSLYNSQTSIALIFNAENASFPGLKYQKMQADWLKENDHLIRQYCLGTAYVIKNSIIRMALNMIFFLHNQPVPYKIVNNQNTAEKWAKEQLLKITKLSV